MEKIGQNYDDFETYSFFFPIKLFALHGIKSSDRPKPYLITISKTPVVRLVKSELQIVQENCQIGL